jgi:exonuclease SbcD
LRLLHTSDWHLGRSLQKIKKRYDEFSSFLDWLIQTIEERKVEALIVAGDIFDNTTPTNRAQELYYTFLKKIVGSGCCRHVVIVAGNHDSPSFLEAPSKLLKSLGVHVIGAAGEDPQREVLTLSDPSGKPELIVCAVPFLREADLRSAQIGETVNERAQKMWLGIKNHYQTVHDVAQKRMETFSQAVPIVATGHLFLAGGKTTQDDGVREIYVGSLSAFPPQDMPSFDYLALGHLHTPQSCGSAQSCRYSGSPIAMGFNEAKQSKHVCLVDLEVGKPATVELLTVPTVQKLERIEGDLPAIIEAISKLKRSNDSKDAKAWIEAFYTGKAPVADLRATLEQQVEGTQIEILSVRDYSSKDLALSGSGDLPQLSSMTPKEVFDRLLADQNIPEDLWPELRSSHAEIATAIEEEDSLSD